MLVHGRAPHHADSGEQAVEDAYRRGETDEFIEPTLVGGEATIRPGDSVIAFNFRPDRMRQLTRALAEPGFGEGPAARGRRSSQGGRAAGEPRRSPAIRRSPATRRAGPTRWCSRRSIRRRRCRWCSRRPGASQLHVAETEKYAHVTYFFNGGEEAPLSGERRELVASPRDVPTYDHKPQMSAREAAAAFVGAWRAGPAAVRDHQLRKRRHGRAHGRDRGGGEGGRDRRRVPGRGGGARCTRAAARAW